MGGSIPRLSNRSRRVKGYSTASRTSSFSFKGRREDVRAIGEVAKAHDLWILSDEVYEALVFDAPGWRSGADRGPGSGSACGTA